MAKKRRESPSFEEKMDMTPLIDCVFLLIMFFILTTEITVRVEAVDLPFALEGNQAKDEGGDTTLLLNVVLRGDDGVERGAADIIVDGNKLDISKLRDKLQQEVTYDMRDPPFGRGRQPEALGDGSTLLSQVKVRVRADKNAAAEHLRTIFMLCQDVHPKIYKIELSSETPSGN